MRGFKSFAESTVIHFTPGINIIVGPNGCGKSNIVDSIRWVLGEGNVRNLRGHRGEDVIFSGSDKKKALGMAVVEVTIDNSDNTLPVDYTEVTLGRKIFRSGETEIFLNKNQTRLKDINALFAGTGLGKKGYSIISQGELEQVLNGQPLDRRLILEEASGIIKYRQQRDEVKKRIADTSNDLLRLGDILDELKQRKEEVALKAEKAQQYIQLNNEYNKLEKEVILAETAKLKDSIKKKGDNLNHIKAKFKDLDRRLQEKEQAVIDLDKNLEVVNNQLNTAKESKHELESQVSSLLGEVRLGGERIKNYRERMDLAGQEKIRYLEMISEFERTLKTQENEYSKQKNDYLANQAGYKQLEEQIEEIKSSLDQYQHKFDMQKSQVFDQVNNEIKLKNQLKDMEGELKKYKEKRERLIIQLDNLKEKILRYNEKAADLKVQARKHENNMQNTETELQKLTEQKNEYNRSLQEIEAQYKQMNEKLSKVKNQLMVIFDMRKNMIGYSPAAKFIMDYAVNKKIKGIIGLTGELIEVPNGLELAIEVAAGKGLESIIVETTDYAQEAIDLLKRQKNGRATFLPLDKLRVQEVPQIVIKQVTHEKGVLGRASDLIKYEARLTKAVEYLLGKVLVVEDMTRAIEVFQKIKYPFRLVSLEGDVVNVSGAMTGGSYKNLHKNSLLKRKNEEKQLVLQEKKLIQLQEQNRNQFTEITDKIKILEQGIMQTKNNMAETTFQHDMLVKEIDTIKQDLENSRVEHRQLSGELLHLDEKIVAQEEEYRKLSLKQQNLQQHNESISQELDTIKDSIDQTRREYDILRERLNFSENQIAAKKRELENLDKNISQLKDVKLSYEKSIPQAEKRVGTLEKEIQTEINRLSEMEKLIKDKEAMVKENSANLENYQNIKNQLLNHITAVKQEIVPLKAEFLTMQRTVNNLEMDQVKAKTELEGLIEKYREKFKQEPIWATAKIITTAETRGKKRQIEDIKNRIEEIGPVDISSVRELNEITTRLNFINTQYQDLLEGRDSLGQLLQKTESIMEEELLKFLQQANDSFNRTFKEIFNGGQAYLRLEEDKDYLNAGINIEVKIPGKKVQSLNLLSGGERALTCIAFIFSLVILKPVPFCLLDEIDAALDEANLLRFTRFIKEVCHKIQFIIITHRQTTIEAGDRIYGITMPEQGVSSVLTIDLSEAEGLAG